MTPALFLPVADHGDIVATLPFVLPALLIVGGLLAMRLVERRRQGESVSDSGRETNIAPLVRDHSKNRS